MSYELRHVLNRHNQPHAHKKDSFLKKTLDRVAYPVAIIGPLSSLDQALRIWQEKSAEGVSPLVWTVLFFTSAFWILYGAVHREKVIFFGHILWIALSGTILFEIILFSHPIFR